MKQYDVDDNNDSSECVVETTHSDTTTESETAATTTETTTTEETVVETTTSIYIGEPPVVETVTTQYTVETYLTYTTLTTVTLPTTNTTTQTYTTSSTSETTTTAVTDTRSFIKTFNRGTYYCYGCQKLGGSGRMLVSCAIGDGVAKGSVASSYLFHQYGYYYNGERTKVYLEIEKYPEMNGYYYLDDSDAGNPDVIDFFYIYDTDCPFKNVGVVSVNCYIDT